MTKQFTLCAAVAATSLIASEQTKATTVLIDFGRDNTVTAGSEAGGVYNTVAIPTNVNNATTGDVPLSDTGTNPTGWTINVTENGSGNGGRAGSGADMTTFPAAVSGFDTNALKDSLFANNAGSGPVSMVVTISGLDDTKTYDLLLYGGRINNQNLFQTWSLTEGTGGANVSHDSLGNTTVAVDWDSISTNGSGVIAFSISGNSGSGAAAAINFGQIIEVPEPSSLALIGIGGLLIARRRRS